MRITLVCFPRKRATKSSSGFLLPSSDHNMKQASSRIFVSHTPNAHTHTRTPRSICLPFALARGDLVFLVMGSVCRGGQISYCVTCHPRVFSSLVPYLSPAKVVRLTFRATFLQPRCYDASQGGAERGVRKIRGVCVKTSLGKLVLFCVVVLKASPQWAASCSHCSWANLLPSGTFH